jgi:hypothetical protein
MTQYKGYDVAVDSDGATYSCPTCREPLRYGNHADVDTLNAELDSHKCAPPAPRFDWPAWAEREYDAYKRKREGKAEALTQQQIDGREKDWYKRSQTTNAKIARLLEAKQ